jgi:hypothetical protein
VADVDPAHRQSGVTILQPASSFALPRAHQSNVKHLEATTIDRSITYRRIDFFQLSVAVSPSRHGVFVTALSGDIA